MIHDKYFTELEKQEALITRKNVPDEFYNGIYTKYK